MNPVRDEARILTRLAFPVIVTQLNMMMLGVVDTIMVGHVGVDALGAAALGRLWVFGTAMIGLGLLLGVDPLITQGHGSRNPVLLGRTLQQGLVLGGIIGLATGLAWLLVEPVLLVFGQDPVLVDMARDYVWIQIPSILIFFGFPVLRQYLQGRGILRPAMFVAIAANLVNVFFNWMFIYGNLGAPAMGLTGAGLASAFSRFFMFAGLVSVILIWKLYRDAWVPWSREAFSLAGMRRILHYGVPISIQFGLELWTFQIATLLAGRLGQVPLAAHTIAINLTSLAFMFPLGLSMGTVTRVGNLIGAGEGRRAQLSSYVALGMGAAAMGILALVFVVFRDLLPRIYTSDPEVLALAAVILPIGAAFQIADGTQNVGGGILRGMGKTRPAAGFNLIGFYVLGLPLGWWMAFKLGIGLPGVWWGLCIGLSVVAVLLVLWIRVKGPGKEDAMIREVKAG